MGGLVCRFFSRQGDSFIRNEFDALSVLFGEGYSNIAKLEEGSLNGLWKDVEACKTHINSVRSMLTYMGLSTNQTDSVIMVMCNDRSAIDQIPKLVNLYKECKVLAAFANKDDRNQRRAQVAMEAKKVEFTLVLRNILPMDIADHHIQDILAEIECQKNHTSVNQALMEVAGWYETGAVEQSDDKETFGYKINEPIEYSPQVHGLRAEQQKPSGPALSHQQQTKPLPRKEKSLVWVR